MSHSVSAISAGDGSPGQGIPTRERCPGNSPWAHTESRKRFCQVVRESALVPVITVRYRYAAWRSPAIMGCCSIHVRSPGVLIACSIPSWCNRRDTTVDVIAAATGQRPVRCLPVCDTRARRCGGTRHTHSPRARWMLECVGASVTRRRYAPSDRGGPEYTQGRAITQRRERHPIRPNGFVDSHARSPQRIADHRWDRSESMGYR